MLSIRLLDELSTVQTKNGTATRARLWVVLQAVALHLPSRVDRNLHAASGVVPSRMLHVICCNCAVQHGGQFSANGSDRGNDVTGVSVTCALICVSIGPRHR